MELEAWRGSGLSAGNAGGGGVWGLEQGAILVRTQPTADQPSHAVPQRFSHAPIDTEAEKCTGYDISFYSININNCRRKKVDFLTLTSSCFLDMMDLLKFNICKDW